MLLILVSFQVVLVALREDAVGSCRAINWELILVSEKQDAYFKKNNNETITKPNIIHEVTGN